MKNDRIGEWEKEFIAYFRTADERMDGSHDLGHFQRVWRTARYINREEGEPADSLILLAAAYFHDLVALPKNHPERKESSRLSAERAAGLLASRWAGGSIGGRPPGMEFPREKVEGVRHAIHAHSYSAGVTPLTAEAKILQDADRMEAMGAIGLARVFYTAGQLNQLLFDGDDPLAESRVADDQRYALDHFQVKLLRLPALMNTETGRRLAGANADYLREFLRKIRAEIAGLEV